VSDKAIFPDEESAAKAIPHLVAGTAPAICLLLVLTAPVVAINRLGAVVAPDVEDVLSYSNGLSFIWIAAGAIMGLAALMANWMLKRRPGVIHKQVRDGRLRGPIPESSRNAAEYEIWEEKAETVARRESEISRATWSSVTRTLTSWGTATVCLGSVVGVLSWAVVG
jgi:hypothetical protein